MTSTTTTTPLDQSLVYPSPLKEFWSAFSEAADGVKDLKIQEVIEKLEESLEAHIFPSSPENPEPRVCKACGNGKLSLKLGKFGAFIGCSNYPECRFTRELIPAEDGEEKPASQNFPKELGLDDATGKAVTLKLGPYGLYVQLGEDTKDKEDKPKRVAIPKGTDPETIDFEKAKLLLSLPRRVGHHPETGKVINAGLGRFGPYLLHDGKYGKLESLEDVLTIGINRAVDIIAGKINTKSAAKVVGKHPESDKNIELVSGRYGPYIKCDGRNYKIPKGTDAGTLSEEDAVKIVMESAPTEKSAARNAKKKAPAKAAAETKKPAAKKSAKSKKDAA